MKDNQDCYNKEINLKKFGSAHDKFILNVANAKVKIVTVNIKPLISSYFIGSDDCGRCLNVYGIIFVEIIYRTDKDTKKLNQVFATTFTQLIYIPNDKCKICSVTVDIADKCIKKLSECNIVGFFTLLFMVKLNVHENEVEDSCNNEFEDFECMDSIEIDHEFEDCCECKKDKVCKRSKERRRNKRRKHCDEEAYNDVVSEEEDSEPHITFKNDSFGYFTNFQRQNRV